MKKISISGLALLAIPLIAASPSEEKRVNSQPSQKEELSRLQDTVRGQQKQIATQAKEIAELREVVTELTKKLAQLHEDGKKMQDQSGELTERMDRVLRSRKELLGRWKVVPVEEGGGAELPAKSGRPDRGAVSRVVFAGKTVTFQYQDGRKAVLACKLDATEDPREIDVYWGGVKPLLGIYQLSRDPKGATERLKICLDRDNATRPRGFNDGLGANTILWVLEREERLDGDTSHTKGSQGAVKK